MEHGARTRLVTAFVLLVVFGSGVLLGFAVDSSLVATPVTNVTTSADDKDDDGERRSTMYGQVGPTAEQTVLIDSIVVEHRARMDALHEEFREAYDPRYRALVVQAREAIKDVFTPEQAAQYQQIIEETERRRAERDAQGGGDEDRD